MIAFFHVLFYVLCTIILLQDIIGIFLFNLGIQRYLLQIFLSLKDTLIFIIMALNFITCAAKKIKIAFNATIYLFACYFAIVLYYFLIQDNKTEIINDFRSLIFPVYAYIAGYTSFYLREKRMIKYMSGVAFLSVVCSILLYISGPGFFVKIGTLSYTEQVRGYYGLIFNMLPSTFFSAFGNATIFRLTGPVLNPISTATLFIFVMLVICYENSVRLSTGKKLLLALLALAIFLTFSRGPIFGLLLGLLVANTLFSKRYAKKRVLYLYSIIVILIIVFFNNFANMVQDTFRLSGQSSRSHFSALVQSWEYIKNNWLGSGIGASGQWIATDAYTAGENSFAMVIGQVGIFSFLFIMLAYLSVFKNLIRRKGWCVNYGLLIFFITILFNGLFSPGLFSVTPLMLFWFFVGYSENRMIPKRTYPDEVVSVKSQT